MSSSVQGAVEVSGANPFWATSRAVEKGEGLAEAHLDSARDGHPKQLPRADDVTPSRKRRVARRYTIVAMAACGLAAVGAWPVAGILVGATAAFHLFRNRHGRTRP